MVLWEVEQANIRTFDGTIMSMGSMDHGQSMGYLWPGGRFNVIWVAGETPTSGEINITPMCVAWKELTQKSNCNSNIFGKAPSLFMAGMRSLGGAVATPTPSC